MPTLTLNLPEDAIRTVREHVEGGLFSDENAFIYEAIRQVDVREYESKLQKLKDALAPGIEQALNGQCRKFTIDELRREVESSS